MSDLTHHEEKMRLRLQLAQHKEYLDVNDVVILTGFSKSTIFRRVSQGILKPFQSVPNGKLLFSSQAIKDFIEGGKR